ncbi:MAG TPA: proteasome subunit alpha [Actinobacteria bacterium]|nr:proteasome subunit alpha [Actinomycetota bacterium]
MTLPYYVPPEQLIKDRADFARKGIARGRSIVALEYVDGILLMGGNPSSALHKLSEIYDRIAFAGVGRYNEFETLRVAGIRYADLKGYSYNRTDVSAKGLANAYSQTVGQIFTHEVKPYEVEVLVAEVGDVPEDDRMYHVRFDGTLHDAHRFAALGGHDERLAERLAEGWRPGLDLAEAIRLAAVSIEAVEETEIPPEGWEAAVLDRTLGRRKFRRLRPDEIAAARAAGPGPDGPTASDEAEDG